jgi:hypothetical protein
VVSRSRSYWRGGEQKVLVSDEGGIICRIDSGSFLQEVRTFATQSESEEKLEDVRKLVDVESNIPEFRER